MSTKQKTKQQSSYSDTVTPTAPGWIAGSQQQTQNLINQFKNTDPNAFVAGNSPLQNMAYAGGEALARRMGIAPSQSSQGLLAATSGMAPKRSAVMPGPATGIQGGAVSGQPDYGALVDNNPDLSQEYARIAGGGFGPNLPASYDANGDGEVQKAEYGNFWNQRFNGSEGRPVPGLSSQAVLGPATGFEVAGPGVEQGYGGDLASPDPNAMFAQAGLLANGVGNAGANMAGRNTLGDANTAGRNVLGDANTAGRNVLGDATQSQTGVLGDAPMIGDIGRMDAAQIGEADIARLMNPYQRNVIDASLAQYDASRDQAAARMAADAAGRGAFSDGRYGIAEGEFNASTARDRASLEAGLLSQGFNTALSAAENDVARRQQAGAMNFDANVQRLLANQGVDSAFALNRYGTETQNNQFNTANQNAFRADQFAADNQRDQFNVNNQNVFARDQFGADNALNMFNAQQGDTALARALQSAGLLGDLGNTVSANDRANLGLLSGLGEQQRGVNQDQLNAIPTWLQLISQLEGGMGYGNYFGQTGSGTETSTRTESGPRQWLDTMSAIGQGAQAGAILFSDERLKENIRTAGYDDKGRRWVDYNYKGDPTPRRGVIAQEIARSDPGAVIPDESGFLKVDYSKLGGVNV